MIIAFFGLGYVFVISSSLYIEIGLLTLLTGGLVFFVWTKRRAIWLFYPSQELESA